MHREAYEPPPEKDDWGENVGMGVALRSRSAADKTQPALREPDVLSRIKSFAIPPGWTDVWI
jgi:hypothetical protein